MKPVVIEIHEIKAETAPSAETIRKGQALLEKLREEEPLHLRVIEHRQPGLLPRAELEIKDEFLKPN